MSISKDNNYVIYFEPMDIVAETPEEAMRKVKYVETIVSKIIIVDKNGLPKG